MHVSLVWWNTGLSPTRKKDRSSPEEQRTAATIVRTLTTIAPVDFIGLCEVSPNDIDWIQESCQAAGYQVHRATDSAGRSAFDMCVLYRREKIAVLETRNVLSSKGERVTRVGHHLTLAVRDEEEPFHVFLSHWPSRMHLPQHDPARELLGTRLRDAIDEILGPNPAAKIILLGDYNDEPFDTSIADNIMATRDRALAVRRKHLFYNPFWRHLSSFEDSTTDMVTDSGSYFHKAGHSTQWRTFDQMMFSSSFLGLDAWHLVERNTRVLDLPDYTSLVRAANTCFDHLPIVGHIHKRTKENG